MDQRDSHCPYSLSSEITAKPTVLVILMCHFVSQQYRDLYITKRLQTPVLLVEMVIHCICATSGQEDPFELDSNLLLSSGRHGEDRKRQYLWYDHETPLLDDLADLLY